MLNVVDKFASLPPSPGPFPHKEGRGANDSEPEIGDESSSPLVGEGFRVGGL